MSSIQSKEGKDQESIQSSTTPDPGTPYGKVTKTQENITLKSQEVSPFPAGDHKATRNRQDSTTKTNLKRK